MILLFCLGLIFVHTATSASISATTTAPGCTLIALKQDKNTNWTIFTQNYQFIYAPKTSKNGEISIPVGKSIEISCPGSTAKGIPSKETNNATCVSGTKFKINNVVYDLPHVNLHCVAKPISDARLTGMKCENNSKEVKLGFNLPGDKYIQQIRLCFDPTTQLALYSHYVMIGSTGAHDIKVPNMIFIPDTFYSKDIESLQNLYNIEKQRKTINTLLGYPENNDIYIKSKGNFSLTKGHFAARGDFVYESQKRATYHFVNAAPQWQIFNNGNWKTFESCLTAYANISSKNFEIYSGAFGISTLPHKNGTRIPLYLYVNKNKKYLPVPELFWKAIYEPISKRAVVVFGVNNPYYKNKDEIKKANSIICPNAISNLNGWLRFKNSHDIQQGYMYACEFAEAKKKITYLPDWKVTGILK